MDWPVASVVLGTLGTIAVAILKMIPAREHKSYRKCDDIRRNADFAVLVIEVAGLKTEVQELKRIVSQLTATVNRHWREEKP